MILILVVCFWRGIRTRVLFDMGWDAQIGPRRIAIDKVAVRL